MLNRKTFKRYLFIGCFKLQAFQRETSRLILSERF